MRCGVRCGVPHSYALSGSVLAVGPHVRASDRTHAVEACITPLSPGYPGSVTATSPTNPDVDNNSVANPGLVRKIYNQLQGVIHEFAKFGAVGLSALVVDIGLFNILLYAGPLEGKPLTAKAISVAVATTFAYLGNRFWTFKHRGGSGPTRELLLFFGLNGVAMLIAMGCLWFSHYALGFTSPLADNISANVIGLGLGTLFRFWSYRKFVFPEVDDAEERKRLMGSVEI